MNYLCELYVKVKARYINVVRLRLFIVIMNNYRNFLFLILLFWGTFLSAREEPLRQLVTSRLIEVDRFPGNDNDKIMSALSSISEGGGTEIRFSNRVYRFSEVGKRALIELNGVKNLFINGNGAQLLFSSLEMRLLHAKDCQNLIVQNISIDFDPLHFTQGEVIEVHKEGRSLVVKKDQGYPDFTAPHFGNEPLRGMFHDRVFAIIRQADRSGMHKRGSDNNYGVKSIEKLSDNTFKIGFDAINVISKGDIFVLVPHKLMGGPMCHIEGGSQISLIDIDLYGGGVGVLGQADCLNLIDFKIIRRPGTNRLLTLARDGFILGHNRVGPWFENCTVECNGDDGINFHTRGFTLLENSKTPDNEVMFIDRSFGSKSKLPIAAKGDSVVIYDMFAGKEIQRVHVLSAKRESSKEIFCRLSAPLLPEVDLSSPKCRQRYAVFNLSYSADEFLVRGCHFESVRRHALFLPQGSNGVIENCTFKTTSGCVLYTGVEHATSIGYGLHNVLFRNNIMTDCYVASESRCGLGWIVSLSSDVKYSETHSFHVDHLQFVNNEFRDIRSTVFQLSNTDCCVIRHNTFQLNPSYKASLNELINLKAANRNTTIEQNTIQ